MVIALTFASIPDTGVFDTDMLYRMQIHPTPERSKPGGDEDHSLGTPGYFDAVKRNFLGQLKASEIRVTVDQSQRATVKFIDFPGGEFSTVIDTNNVTRSTLPDAVTAEIKAYIGGRDDAFFNDLTGFFRSINYAPQFYHVPHTMTGLRELKIPKTLIELEGNHPVQPRSERSGMGLHGNKRDLPPGPLTWNGDKFFKDANGNYRFVYDGRGRPGRHKHQRDHPGDTARLHHRSPDQDRIVNCWGESWVLKAANKIETIPDDPFWLENPLALIAIEARRRVEEVQAGRHRRSAVRRRRAQRT